MPGSIIICSFWHEFPLIETAFRTFLFELVIDVARSMIFCNFAIECTSRDTENLNFLIKQPGCRHHATLVSTFS